ncbi:MAG: beta strand repeat-containing protein, partial [Gaiellaceae bacterium]
MGSSVAVGQQQDLLSLLALRERAIRVWLAAIGLVAFGTAYTGPIALSFRVPAVSSSPVVLPVLELPPLGLPTLAVPKLEAAPTVPPVRAPAPAARSVVHQPAATAPAPAHRAATHRARTVHVPVVHDQYSVAPAATPAPAKKHDAFAAAPVVEDVVGAVPADTATTAADATASVTVEEATAPEAPALPADETPAPVQATASTSDLPDYASQPATLYSAPVPAAAQDATAAAAEIDPESNEPVASTAAAPPAADSSFPASPATSAPADTAVQATAADTTATQPATPAVPADTTPAASGGTTTTSDSTSGSSSNTSPPPAVVPKASWTVSTAASGDHAISVATTDTDAIVTIDGAATTKLLSDLPDGIAIVGGAGADTFTVASAAVSVVFDGGAGNDTVVGPSTDTNWNVTGAGAGNVGKVTFADVETLSGAPGNKDTFVLKVGGSLAGGVDGGAGGFDSLVVEGPRGSVESQPTDAHSGTLVVDGVPIHYAGLEPISISAGNVTIHGADLSGTTTEIGDKDLFKISMNGAGTSIEVKDFDPTGTFELSESHSVSLSGLSTLTINGGLGGDTVQFTGNVTAPGVTLNVNAETIKVDANVKIDVGSGDINLSAVTHDNGLSVFGITTTIPVLGASGLVDISPDDGDWSSGDDYDTGDVVLDPSDHQQYRALHDVDNDTTAPHSDPANWALAGSAQLIGHTINLKAFAGSLTTTVVGNQTLGTDLVVASVSNFENTGNFVATVGGSSTTCSYTGRNVTSGVHKFTGVSGCSGSVSDGAEVRKDISENGSGTGINHAGLDLEYHANVNVHGASQITATGNVTLSSAVDVTAKGNAAGGPDKGNWAAGSYTKGDIVKGSDGKRYAATKDIVAGSSDDKDPVSNHGLLDAWTEAKDHDASVAATFVLAIAKSQLSGTSAISAPGKDVSIGSNVKTNVSTNADSSASGLGAGIAVAVFVTQSGAFIDSNAATPVSAANLAISADTDNAAPTSGKSSPKGSDGDASKSTSANTPLQSASTNVDNGGGGGQSLAGGTLAVKSTAGFAASGTFTVAGIGGTCSYKSIDGTHFTGITACTGTPDDNASVTGSSAQQAGGGTTGDGKSKTGDGDQNKSAALAVTVLVATTQAYIAPTDASSPHAITTTGGTQTLHAGAKNSATADADAGNVKFAPDAPTFTGAATTGGFLEGGKTYYYRVSAVYAGGESLPGGEGKYDVPSGTNTNKITLNWIALTDATGYKVYRGTESGQEQLLATLGNVLTYADNTNATPSGAMPTSDTSSGIAVAVAVNVAVITTKAYVAGNASLTATGVTLEVTAPDKSTFTTSSTSGAGGSNIGFAGSVSVNILVAEATAVIDKPTPVAVNGNLTLNATSNFENKAEAKAKQATDGKAAGIGASVAVHVVNDTTTAGIAKDADVTGVHDLTINATSTDTMTTTAEGGASTGSDGSFSFGAEVAISISNITTSATVDSGPALTVSGAVTAHATQTAKVTTTANGNTKGGNASIGLSLALVAANHLVDSQLKRTLTSTATGTTGAVGFTADGSSSTDTEATASAAGAKGKSGGGAEDKDSTNNDVNEKADKNLQVGNNASTSSGGKSSGSSSTPESKSGENGGTKVTVAAAVGIALVTANALAGLADGKDVTTHGGSVKFHTSEDADSTVKANGSAVDGTTANIGAAVAINLVHVLNEAKIGLNSLVTSNGLELVAVMRSSGGANGKNTLDTEATAGAGKGSFAVAGALALTIADVKTNAEILSNAGRGPPDDLNGNDLTLTATAVVESTTKAKAKDEGSEKVGIGAGASINSVDDTTSASIDDGAAITGAKKVTLTATDTDSMTTYAEAGTAGAPGSTLAFTADASIALPTVKTSATIGGGTSQTLIASDDVSLSATQTAKATTTAKADAVTGTVVIGLALALAIPDDEVLATVSRTVTGKSVSLSAVGSSSVETEADASAAGAAGKNAGTGKDGSGKDANGKADDNLSSANSQRTAGTGKTANTSNTSNAKAQTSDDNGTSSGDKNTVTVAGAFAINITKTRSEASLADTAVVTATTGAVSVTTQANSDSKANGTGKAKEAGTVGIGVGVSVNKVDITNLASTGNATVNGNGLVVSATMRDSSDDPIQRFQDGKWSAIDAGESFPEQPSSDDYFELTKAAPATTTVDGAQSLGTTLKVKSLAEFGTSGTFKVTGIDKTCSYSGVNSGTHELTGITGCSGSVADKVTVTLTTSTKVATPIAALGSTLLVVSTAGFETSGKFTIAGISGTCSYTSTDSTHFFGVSGCTGTPKDGAAVTRIQRAPGVYKWDGSTWGNAVTTRDAVSHGTSMPPSPSNGAFFILAEHVVSALAASGAGGDKDTLSLAGSLALNIVTLHTDALVGATANVTATGGDVKLAAQSNEADTAKADSDAKAGKIGIGASVGLNILTDNRVRAAVLAGATFTGGGKLDITATQRHVVETEDKAGTAGGIAISPSVSIAVVDDHTTALLGSGSALTITGDATIQATEELESNLESDAEAAGKDVAVGAAVAVNVVTTTTSADVNRSLTAGAITIGATTSSLNDVLTTASAKGESQDSDGGKQADTQSNDQVKNNPNTNGKTGGDLPKSNDSASQGNGEASSQSGSKGGGVGVAAGVSVNWVRGTNTASVGSGVTLTGSGAVKVSAQLETGATAKAIAVAFDLSLSGSDARVAAAVGFNYTDVHNMALVRQDAQVSGNGITVEAVMPAGKENDFVALGASAAGGKTKAAVAASIAIQVISYDTKAQVEQGAHLLSDGAITIKAESTIGLQSIAAGGSLALNGVGVGGGIVVNVLPAVQTQALVESNSSTHITQLDALLGISVTATTTFKPLDLSAVTLPAGILSVSSIAAGGAGSSGDAAVTGSVIVDVFSFTTEAHIAGGSQVNRHPKLGWTPGATQTVSVVATDHTDVVNIAGGLAFTTGDAAVGIGLDVDVIDKTTKAFIGDSQATMVSAAGKVTVKADSSETFFAVAADIAVSTSGTAFDGSIIVLVLNPVGGTGTFASIGAGTTLAANGDVEVTAVDKVGDANKVGIRLIAGNLQFGSSAGIGIASAILVRSGTVDAAVKGGDITSRGTNGLSVSATQSENVFLLAVAGSGGGDAGVAGSVVVDVQNNTTKAHIDNGARVNCAIADSCANGGSPSSSQGVAVAATDTTTIVSIAGALAYGGSAGVGVGIDVEVVTKDTEAFVGNAGTAQAKGNVSVDATSSEDVLSISVGGGFSGTAAVTVNAGVSVLDVTTKAYVADGTNSGNGAKIFADGSVRVAADESLTLNVIAGNISGGGTAAVGAAVSVPVVTKETHSWIGNFAQVNGNGGSSLPVKTGEYSVTPVDTR